MLQIIVESVAAFIGGYLTQLAQNKKISIFKLFLYSLFIMLFVCLIFALVSQNFSLDVILMTLSLSVLIASLIALLVYYSLRRQKKE